jgi:D-alanyl-D-alanine carboxypeptidase (penicillin-binding protein 5/6)
LLGACANIPMDNGAGGAGSSIVVDFTHKKILSSSNADKPRPVASLTKVATVSVVLDWLQKHTQTQASMMVVPNSVSLLGGPNPIGLQPGDAISVRDALFSAMLGSDNLAAQTMADHFGRQMIREVGGQDPVAVFVDQMNALSASLNMTKTKFVNPHGLDHAGPVGQSTATDIAKLAWYAIQDSAFNFLCSQVERKVSYQRNGQELAFNVRSTNRLLGQHGIDGVKTGSTTRAGDCLITSARRNDKIIPLDGNRTQRIPYRLISVVLGSPDRFGETPRILQNGWRQYDAWMANGMLVSDPTEMLQTKPVPR